MTPDEIANYPLKTAMRGYNVQQVDELLDLVADELEHVQGELDAARAALSSTENRLSEASEAEDTLKRTLVTAQRAAELSIEDAKGRSGELLEEAQREAEAIIAAARTQAEDLKVEALQSARAEEADLRARRRDLERHIEALRVFEDDYRDRLRRHMQEQLRLFERVETDGLTRDPDALRSLLRGRPAPTADAIVLDPEAAADVLAEDTPVPVPAVTGSGSVGEATDELTAALASVDRSRAAEASADLDGRDGSVSSASAAEGDVGER